MNLDKTVNWIEKIQGRDKFCKIIQYGAKLLKYYAQKHGRINIAGRLNALYMALTDARKLYRMCKSINQYQSISDMIYSQQSQNSLVLKILVRLSYMFYWFMDNIAIMIRVGIVSGDSKYYSCKGAQCWIIALLISFIIIVQDIYRNIRKIKQYKNETMYSEKKTEDSKLLAKINQQKKRSVELLLNFLRILFNIFPAIQNSLILQGTAWEISEPLADVGGIVAGIISSYQLF